MSSLTLRHPEDGQLLQYLDGELDRRQSRSVQGHLEACWECRAELESLQATVNDCVRYRKQVLIPNLPAPPAAWGSLDFASADAELGREPLASRLGRWISPRSRVSLRWAFAGAMALALGLVIFRQLDETPKVEAAALLRKAVEISSARPQPVKRLRIVSSHGTITRISGGASIGTAIGTSIGTSIHQAAGEAEIARLFAAARYDWNDPLSARAYTAWREALDRKVDEVSTLDPAVYSIKTTTPDSELISATLKLRKTDFVPLEGRFEFRNREWVEMTELVDQHSNPASTVAGTTGGRPRQPGLPPGPSFTEPVAARETPVPSEELQVFAALHELGADLGDPLEITREGRDVVVSGAGIGPERQQQIHSRLDRLPHVVVRFSDPTFPASTPAAEPATTRDAAVPADRTSYQARIEQRLGGRPQFERFSGQLLDWTDAAMARAYALHRLAQQFPPVAVGTMRIEDRRKLQTLGREHLAAMQKNLAQIQTTVNPVLKGIGGTAGPGEVPSGNVAWQPAAEQMLASAHRVETLLAVVLGLSNATAVADAPSQLLTALGELDREITQCQQLLSIE